MEEAGIPPRPPNDSGGIRDEKELMSLKPMVPFTLAIAAVALFMVGRSSIERMFLSYPTHRPDANGLAPWIENGEVIGYSRKVESPRNAWLMLHGNGGHNDWALEGRVRIRNP
jgi:hypothetical protein